MTSGSGQAGMRCVDAVACCPNLSGEAGGSRLSGVEWAEEMHTDSLGKKSGASHRNSGALRSSISHSDRLTLDLRQTLRPQGHGFTSLSTRSYLPLCSRRPVSPKSLLSGEHVLLQCKKVKEPRGEGGLSRTGCSGKGLI